MVFPAGERIVCHENAKDAAKWKFIPNCSPLFRIIRPGDSTQPNNLTSEYSHLTHQSDAAGDSVANRQNSDWQEVKKQGGASCDTATSY
jgi:hypothetical protein